jgi:nucleosome binding factor SPN SPT16 subunit
LGELRMGDSQLDPAGGRRRRGRTGEADELSDEPKTAILQKEFASFRPDAVKLVCEELDELDRKISVGKKGVLQAIGGDDNHF